MKNLKVMFTTSKFIHKTKHLKNKKSYLSVFQSNLSSVFAFILSYNFASNCYYTSTETMWLRKSTTQIIWVFFSRDSHLVLNFLLALSRWFMIFLQNGSMALMLSTSTRNLITSSWECKGRSARHGH